MTRPITDEQRSILRDYLDEAFVRFKDVIKTGRPVFNKDPDALDQLATGEVFTADQAKKHGLIDEIGFIEDAIERAMEMAKLDESKTRVVEFERPMTLLDLPFAVESRLESPGLDLASWLELHAPRAYYLATTLPPLMSQRRR
jgi:protease-4